MTCLASLPLLRRLINLVPSMFNKIINKFIYKRFLPESISHGNGSNEKHGDKNCQQTFKVSASYLVLTQLAFTCSKSTIETPEQCEICSKLMIKAPERLVNFDKISHCPYVPIMDFGQVSTGWGKDRKCYLCLVKGFIIEQNIIEQC